MWTVIPSITRLQNTIPLTNYDDICFGEVPLRDAKAYRKTLYLGKVIEFDIEAKRIFALIGRLLSAGGELISNTLLLGVERLATSNEGGYC